MKGSTIWIAGSIVVASLFISGAIFARPSGGTVVQAGGNGTAPTQNAKTVKGLGLREVSTSDHIRGNPSAKVTIIEFSDFECPFCARLHPTLTRLIEEKGDEVAWVYRHFPLSSIHRNAVASAVASECVANLGGNDAFWEFADTTFQNQRDLSSEALERYALKTGIDAAAYRACISKDDVRREVLTDGSEAQRAGGRGTPFSVIVTENGDAIPFSGALPYETIRGLIDQLL